MQQKEFAAPDNQMQTHPATTSPWHLNNIESPGWPIRTTTLKPSEFLSQSTHRIVSIFAVFVRSENQQSSVVRSDQQTIYCHYWTNTSSARLRCGTRGELVGYSAARQDRYIRTFAPYASQFRKNKCSDSYSRHHIQLPHARAAMLLGVLHGSDTWTARHFASR